MITESTTLLFLVQFSLDLQICFPRCVNIITYASLGEKQTLAPLTHWVAVAVNVLLLLPASISSPSKAEESVGAAKNTQSRPSLNIFPLCLRTLTSHIRGCVCVCHLCVKHLTQIKLSLCAHIQRGNKSSLPGGTKQLLISLWEADGVLINTNSSMITAIQNKRPRLQPDGTNSPRSPQFTCRTLHRSVTSAGPTNTLAPYAQIYSGNSPVFYNQSINQSSISCLGDQCFGLKDNQFTVSEERKQKIFTSNKLTSKPSIDYHNSSN